MIKAEETYKAIDDAIARYSIEIEKMIGEGKKVTDDVIALAELVSASANYKMVYRCHESGSLRGVR